VKTGPQTMIPIGIMLFVGVVSCSQEAVPPFTHTPDTTPPVITAIKVEQAVYDMVEVIWRTDEPTIGRLEYGLAPNIDSISPWTAEMTTSNGIIQTGLQHYGLYSCRVRVKDAAGNETVSAETTVYIWAVAGEGTPRWNISFSRVCRGLASFLLGARRVGTVDVVGTQLG